LYFCQNVVVVVLFRGLAIPCDMTKVRREGGLDCADSQRLTASVRSVVRQAYSNVQNTCTTCV
jgi:hypothetical protein